MSNNNTTNSVRTNDKLKIRTKPYKPNIGHPDSDSSLKSSSYSTISSSDQRNCVFVRDTTGYGFKITGNAPVKVIAVRHKGSAWNSGLRANDIILKVNGENVRDKQHSDVVSLIRKQTTVNLLVTSGDLPISSQIPTRSASPSINNPFNELDRMPLVLNKPVYRPSVASNLSSPGDSLNQSIFSSNNYSDHSNRKSTASESSSEYSIGTSSAEADMNSNKNHRTEPLIVRMTSTEFNSLPNKPKPIKPQIANKPTFMDMNLIPNKATVDHVNRTKIMSPTEKDLLTKSHSYNVSSTKPSKLFQSSKKDLEGPRNKTIPTDSVKSTNILTNNHAAMEYETPAISFNTLPKQLSPAKSNLVIQKSKSISNSAFIMGREFDDDNKDDDESDVSLSIIDLLTSTKDALSRSGLVSIVLLYVNEQPLDLNIMMLYYACQLYKSFRTKKDFLADASRLANEIVTTFILEKSPLIVNVEPDVVDEILKKLKSNDNLNAIFNGVSTILFQRLETIVENVRGKIQRGILLQSDLPNLGNEENRDIEMGLLHRTLCNIYNKSTKDGDMSDFTQAKHIGLATIYQYFLKPSLLQSSNMRSRSIDCINMVGNQAKMLPIADIFKVSIFCSAYQQKMFSSIRKKPKSINGHSMIDAVCCQPEECSVCEHLLWGPSPQGLFCTVCQNYFHVNCKKKIKTSCSRKSRRSIISSGSREGSDKTSTSFLGRLSRKSSTSSVKNQAAAESNTSTGSSVPNNGSLIPDDKTNSTNNDDNANFFKAKSEDQLHRIFNNNDRFGSVSDVSILNQNQSLDCGTPTPFTNETATVQIQELVIDESIDDPDMKVNESFDAELEIQATFPSIKPETDKKRLIVQLEFYHKTRYILMNLKRFLYKLVVKWPPSMLIYFKALSLDCIQPFVKLIKSLVTAIENCINDQGFIDLEKSVYDWLSWKNDKRLKKWIVLSSNLCCTNSLNIVKQLKQFMRTVPELVHLMNVKMHKMVIIDELTQIRPLLISLPLIVRNIIKCFSKFDLQYPEQLTTWKSISIKMDYLCEYIDRGCIPLVDWVNNGMIGRRSDKIDWSVKLRESDSIKTEITNYCVDFPRTIFHFPIFDFQMAKIFSWSRNTKRLGIDSRINYLKKGAEVLLIFYQAIIVVLQKENDHYYLKPIKPFKNYNERLFPFLEQSAFMATNGGQEEDSYILNIINKNHEDASLVRVGFSRKEFVDNWLEYFATSNQDISRSISLYKLNDLKEISIPNIPSEFNNNTSSVAKLKPSESILQTQSSIVQPTVPIPVAPTSDITYMDSDEPLVPKLDEPAIIKLEESDIATMDEPVIIPDFKETIIPEVHVPDEKQISSLHLIQGLDRAKNGIESEKGNLCKYLNIPEEQFENTIELINNCGPKTTSDFAVMLFALCGPLLDHTTQLLSVYSQDPSSDIQNNKINIKNTLMRFSTLLHYLDSTNETSNPKENIKDVCSKNIEKVSLIPAINLETVSMIPTGLESSQQDDPTPSEIIEDVKGIISEVIDKSVDQVQNLPPPDKRDSYKYVPEKCKISNTRETPDRASLSLTPTYFHVANPVEEIITTTRAQFILNRNTNSNNS